MSYHITECTYLSPVQVGWHTTSQCTFTVKLDDTQCHRVYFLIQLDGTLCHRVYFVEYPSRYVISFVSKMADNGGENPDTNFVVLQEEESGLSQTILQGTVKGRRRQGRQKKRWEDIKEWTGLEFTKSQRAVENRENGGNWL